MFLDDEIRGVKGFFEKVSSPQFETIYQARRFAGCYERASASKRLTLIVRAFRLTGVSLTLTVQI
jgi:hypothetical protein